MSKPTRPNYPQPPNRMMLRRALFLMGVCGVAAFVVLAAQLFSLQILRHEELEGAALEQQMRQTAVTAGRGTIYDRNGEILAMSATTYTVYISPAEIAMHQEDAARIAEGLSEILNVDREKILSMAGDRKSWYKTVARKIEDEAANAVRVFKDEHGFKGIKIEPDTKRYYPYSSLAAHVIGFVGMDNNGLSGLEYTYDEALTGENGRILRLKNSAGTDMLFHGYESYRDGRNGHSLELTIDATLQYFLEKNLEQAVADYDIQNGAAGIMMDPRTGEILAMASLGDFDLNNYQAVPDEVQAQIDLAANGETASAIRAAAQQKQWRNKAISDTYEPGSTFKIITLAMALEEGLAEESNSFFCGGTTTVVGRGKPLKCWKTVGHGPQSLVQAVQHSCNVAFTNLGLRIGEETYYKYCEAFGFFKANEDTSAGLTGKTGITLPGESGSIWWSRDVFCNPENLSQLAAASFGQTFNITPLQLITAISACCNGGYLMQPYIVSRVADENGQTVEETKPTVIRQVISEETSRRVNAILEQVVGDTKEGTGKNAYVAGYRIAGKTGTSEKVAQDVAGGEKEYIVSFIGYAPADDPQVICLILLDTPSNETGIYISGGQMAAPTVGKIMADVLPYLGLRPEYTEAEAAHLDRPVPELIGLSPAAALSALKSAGLEGRVEGSGDTVLAQLPAAGRTVAGGSTVILSTEGELLPVKEAVPDVTGLLYTEARDRLARQGLYLHTDSTILADSDTVRVAFQSLSPGAEVRRGAVLTVTLVNENDEDYGRY